MTTKLAEKTLVVGSGKGGVGKSTLCVNLAIALAKEGLSVGLIDADVYGPSIPVMLGLRRLSPRTLLSPDGKEVVVPFSKFGLNVMSIGFFIEEAQSVLWRGPMLHAALQKMTHAVKWPKLDILLIDLPPGTGDVPISLSKLMQIDGACVVTTPQQVAIADLVKAVNSFDQLKIPLMGLIENMTGFTPPDSDICYSIFGEAVGPEIAEKLGIPFLGSIPLLPAICRGSDEGYPAAFHQGDENAGHYFHEIAQQLFEGSPCL